jgi:asparagine synthase (glutamine-hydrolysing)
VYPGNRIRQLLYLDQHTYLQSLNDRNDRATMGASIECREPFMDYRLMEGLGTLDKDYLFKGKKSKYILKSTMGKYLPEYILNFRKVGFSVPWNRYILNMPYLREHFEQMDQSEIFRMDPFNQIDIKKIKDDFLNNQSQNELLARQLFFISLWYKIYRERISKLQQAH